MVQTSKTVILFGTMNRLFGFLLLVAVLGVVAASKNDTLEMELGKSFGLLGSGLMGQVSGF